MQGSLTHSYGLADVIRGIYVGRRSGVLRVSRDQVRKQLYFESGSFVFSDTSDADWRFGTLLVRRGKLAQEDLDRVLQLLGAGKRIGMVLRDLGFLSEEGLAEAVEYQITENVYPMFSWPEGEFHFREEDKPAPSDIALSVSTANLILEGVRRIADDDFIRSALGPTDVVVSLAANPLLRFQSVFLRPEEGFILSRIDGLLRIDEICAITPVPEPQVLRCLYGLKCTGILELRTEGEADAVEAPEATVAGFFADYSGVESLLDSSSKPFSGSQPLNPDEEREQREILEFAELVGELDHYGVLGVEPNADATRIRKAYYGLAKRFHPDRHHRSHLSRLQDRLERIFVRVNEAYETLKDERHRAAYDRARERAAAARPEARSAETRTVDPAAEQERVRKLAESSFREGKLLFEKGEVFGAIRAFRLAVHMQRDKATYHSWLGRALGRNPRWRKEAEEHLLKAIELEPGVAEHYAQLGGLYEAAGLRTRAERYLDEALRWDPSNPLALAARQRLGEAERDRDGGKR